MHQVQMPSNQHYGGPSHSHLMNTPDMLGSNQQKPLSQNFPQNHLMTNGDLPENINIPPSYQNRPPKPMPGKDSKSKPKNGGRKATPNGDKKSRDPNSKGASVKKPKIIENIKLHFVQQYFRASDMGYQYENPEGADNAIPYMFFAEGEDGEHKPDEEAEDEVQEVEAEAAAEAVAVAEVVAKVDGQEQEPAPEDNEEQMNVAEREPEEHEEYVPEEEEKESSHSFEPYDPNDVMEIEVKVSTKVKGLKKMILDKIDLYKKANVVLLKKAE